MMKELFSKKATQDILTRIARQYHVNTKKEHSGLYLLSEVLANNLTTDPANTPAKESNGSSTEKFSTNSTNSQTTTSSEQLLRDKRLEEKAHEMALVVQDAARAILTVATSEHILSYLRELSPEELEVVQELIRYNRVDDYADIIKEFFDIIAQSYFIQNDSLSV